MFAWHMKYSGFKPQWKEETEEKEKEGEERRKSRGGRRRGKGGVGDKLVCYPKTHYQ